MLDGDIIIIKDYLKCLNDNNKFLKNTGNKHLIKIIK
jgi:hypothetical protein